MLYRNVGIVGAAADKFDPFHEAVAKHIIGDIFNTAIFAYPSRTPRLISGRCHLGGVDIWAEEIADERKILKDIKVPPTLSWAKGYKVRNMAIAFHSMEVHAIVMGAYVANYAGERFPHCYHCMQRGEHPWHVKSGACWTAWNALSRAGSHRVCTWHIIQLDGSIIRRQITPPPPPIIDRQHITRRYAKPIRRPVQ